MDCKYYFLIIIEIMKISTDSDKNQDESFLDGIAKYLMKREAN
jgi:hypothetical protein